MEEAAQSQQLLQIERHWKDVLDAMFAFVALMEPDGTITWMNRAARSVAGPVDAVGTNFTELYSFGHSPRLREQLAESVRRAAAGEVVKGSWRTGHPTMRPWASPSPSRPASTPAAGSSS